MCDGRGGQERVCAGNMPSGCGFESNPVLCGWVRALREGLCGLAWKLAATLSLVGAPPFPLGKDPPRPWAVCCFACPLSAVGRGSLG